MRLTAILLLLALARATASAQDLTAVIVGGQSAYQVNELNPRLRRDALSAGDTMGARRGRAVDVTRPE